MSKKPRKQNRHARESKTVIVNDPHIERDLVIDVSLQQPESKHFPPVVKLEHVLECSKNQCEYARVKVGGKYKSALYIRREVDSEILNWLSSESPNRATALVLRERAGSGKTNLLCRLSEILPQTGLPTVLHLGSDQLENRYSIVTDTFRGLGFDQVDIQHAGRQFSELLRILRGKPVCILLDAINEARDVTLMKNALRELFALFGKAKCRVLITCRDIYWTFLEGDWRESAKCDVRTYNLYHYDTTAWNDAQALYFKAYKIHGTLSGEAEYQCRHPLLFRFFCEAYANENVSTVTNIRLKPLFEKYLEKKSEMISDEQTGHLRNSELVGLTLQRIASEMLDSRQISLPESHVARIIGDNDHLLRGSLYVRLLDEDIMLEEIPDQSSKVLKRRVRFVYEAFLEFVLARVLLTRWESLTNEDIVNIITKLLEPTACMRNVLGALQFLRDFFSERSLNIWDTFVKLGPAWQNFIIQTISESVPSEIEALQIEAFWSLEGTTSVETRRAAISLLGSSEHRAVLDPHFVFLLSRLKEDPRQEVRAEALSVLSTAWDLISLESRYEILHAMWDRAKGIRKDAIQLRSSLKDRDLEGLLDHVLEATRSQSGSTRSFAFAALDLDVWPKSRPRLLSGLSDENSWVRSACLLKLMYHCDPKDIKTVAPLLKDTVKRVRIIASKLMKVWKLPGFLPNLLEQFSIEIDVRTKGRILNAIAEFSTPEAVNLLSDQLKSDEYWIFRNAGRGLSRNLGLSVLDNLIGAFLDRKEQLILWPRGWLGIDDIGGLEQLVALYENGFKDERFSSSSGAFYGGVHFPRVVTHSKKLNWDWTDWFSQLLKPKPDFVAGPFLSGLCRTDHDPLVVTDHPEIHRDLVQLIWEDKPKTSPYAAHLLSMSKTPLTEEMINFVLDQASPLLRYQFAVGLTRSDRFEAVNLPRSERLLAERIRSEYNQFYHDINVDESPF